MTIKEIFNFKSSFSKIITESYVNSMFPEREDVLKLEDNDEMFEDIRTEWNQEYELIYLSYVLER